MTDPRYQNRQYEQQPYSAQQQPGQQQYQPYAPPEPEKHINLGKLWAGGFGTAVVAALIIVVGVLLVRGVLQVALLSPTGTGTYGTISTTSYAFSGAVAALMATGLLNILLAAMPNPMQFFYWITGLATAAAALLPLTLIADWGPKLATSAINLVAGLAIITILGSIGGSAVEYTQPSEYR
ncbi:DUF6069 family protein [Nocardia thailandica]|uniref:DUF6069 family protein n=1 Tax=Nocardia thailandica TaxID=257275 RepID=A0ABW6PFS6_9NOCA|nr:DUF6069 family protein [Nocardia thailandica]